MSRVFLNIYKSVSCIANFKKPLFSDFVGFPTPLLSAVWREHHWMSHLHTLKVEEALVPKVIWLIRVSLSHNLCKIKHSNLVQKLVFYPPVRQKMSKLKVIAQECMLRLENLLEIKKFLPCQQKKRKSRIIKVLPALEVHWQNFGAVHLKSQSPDVQ